MEVTDRVLGLAEGYLKEKGIELVEITYRRERGHGMVLRLLVDTPAGISVAECEALNNYLSEILDKEDVISEYYVLEVSSPGLDRPIKTDRDFERAMGRELDITTYQPIDAKRAYEGNLVGMDKDNIVIENGDISTVIPKKTIAIARLKIEI